MDAKITNQLAEIDKLKKTLDGLRPFDQMVWSYFQNHLDALLTYNTNAIEGSTLSFGDTKDILEKGQIYKPANTREILEVLNHRDALRYIETLRQKPPYIVSEAEVLAIHKNILKGIHNERAGVYRCEPVYIRMQSGQVKNFPDWQKVPDLTRGLLQWLRDSAPKYHPVVLSAELHYRFVAIHPFIDGNGRAARLLMNLLLLQNGYPLADISLGKRAEYMLAISTADNTQDLTEFYLVVLAAVQEMLELYVKTFTERIIWQ
jgi:Fic family protein